MTTTPVSNTGDLMPAQGVKQTTAPEETKSFSDVFKQSTAGNAEQMTKTDNLPVANKTATKVSDRKTEKTGQNIQSRQSAKAKNQTAKAKDDNAVGENRQTTDSLTPEEEEQAMQVLAETAVTVVDKLAELFQISPEEVSDTMELLGMTDADLFDAASFQNLFATLAQDPEGSFLLTGDALADNFNALWDQVSQMFEAAGEANGWSEEQLHSVLEQQRGLFTEASIPTGTEEAITEEVKDTSYTVTFMQDGKEVTYDVTKDGESGAAVTEGMEETEISQTPRTAEEQKQNGQQKHNTQQAETGAELVQEFQPNQMNVSGEQAFTESLSSFSQVDTQSIMDQIMDYMKIDNSEAFTKLEMQLHPETMGRVVIEITSRNGELTAQITTQNEAVRAALESQIVSLKENLNDQGLRVENVQVTVESHAFEQSYEGERQSENSEAFASRPKTHRIHLDDIDLEDEELTDEERMVAELMADRGGTLDYTV